MEKYKILAIADIHMSNRLPYAKPGANDVTDRLQDQLDMIEHAFQIAKSEKVDSIVILGDLFNQSKVDAVTLTHTVGALAATKHQIYILPGNHDANSITGGRYAVEALGAMQHKYIHYLDSELMPTRWLQLLPLPFVSIGEAQERLESAKKLIVDGAVNVLLFHNSVLGCEHMEWTCDDGLDPDDICDGFDWVIGGHFHKPQTFGPQDRGMYCGAPMHHDFGDRGRDAGMWVVEFFEDGKTHKKFIPGKSPKFYVTNETKVDKKWKPGDYVRVEIEATHAQWVKTKPDVRAFCEGLKSIDIRASFKQKPVYQHKKRLKGKGKDAAAQLTLEKAILEYVDAAGVVTTDLDKGALKTIGQAALDTVRSTHGII